MNWWYVLQSALSGCIVVVFGALLTRVPWKRHRDAQDRLNDLLDTSTPGGLGDVEDVLKQHRAPRRSW